MLKINGVSIKTPKDLTIQTHNITKSGRVASGLMGMTFIAKKVKLNVKYAVLSGAELQTIANLIDTEEMFFDVTYETYTGVERTITCYSGALDFDKFRNALSGGGWYWKNVQFALIER